MPQRKKTAVMEFLGTGTSTGVPVPGCTCRVCRSADPHDKRLRASVWLRSGSRSLVIDTGPEFRIQCLRAGIRNLDAVLLTHDHADHLNGLDDIRCYSLFKNKRLPVWGSAETLAAVRLRFGYIWKAVQQGGGLPDITLHEAAGPFSVIGLPVVPVPLKHGVLDILGYRIGDTAYMTDVSSVPEPSLPLLDGIGTMIISCVRWRRHKTHLNIAGVRELHALVRPQRTILTHLSHYMSHKDIIGTFPTDIGPAYDGMKITLTA